MSTARRYLVMMHEFGNVLWLIKSNQGITFKELRRKILLAPNSLRKLLENLQELGFVKKDGNSYYVTSDTFYIEGFGTILLRDDRVVLELDGNISPKKTLRIYTVSKHY